MASSLPGMGKSINSGSQLVSTRATIGIFSRLASATAMPSRLTSTRNIAPGSSSMSATPLKLRSSLISSRRSFAPSFLDVAIKSPLSVTCPCSSRIRDTLRRTVVALVKVPPSQRCTM